MSFAGGTYEECARWLWNILTSHAKRENPRAEVALDAEGEREGKSYGARVRLGDRVSPTLEFGYPEVAEQRGSLAWCSALAARIRGVVRDLAGASDVSAAPR